MVLVLNLHTPPTNMHNSTFTTNQLFKVTFLQLKGYDILLFGL